MKGNVENKNNSPVNIRFVGKTSDIINLCEHQKWQCCFARLFCRLSTFCFQLLRHFQFNCGTTDYCI